MRLFAALPLSPVAVERLMSLRLRLSAPGDGLRWSTPEQWHITLQFYGEVTAEESQELQKALGQLNVTAPWVELTELGMFAAKGILHVLVEPSEDLIALQQETVRLAAGCGFQPESRPYRPHITLARSKGKTGLVTLRKFAKAGLPPLGPPLRFRAPEFLLLESTLRPQGAHYVVQSRIALSVPDALTEGAR